MKAEIITIGDEILIGQTIDTNSAWIADKLNAIGISVSQITSIRDEEAHIISVLDSALRVSDLVFITGGLGPTNDDITKATLCKYFHTELEFHPVIFDKIKEAFEKRGIEVLPSNKAQAMLPRDCEVLENTRGTASGMLFKQDQKIIISMPGVPYEMKVLMEDHIVPRLKNTLLNMEVRHKTVKTIGVGESLLSKILEEWESSLSELNIKLAYLPSPGIVKLRLTRIASSGEESERLINNKLEELHQLIPEIIYGYDQDEIEDVIGKLLLSKNATLATAESCTGGNIAHMITTVSGSSEYFIGSIVSYSNTVKINQLDVNAEDIETFGAVSEEVVKQMAEGVRKKLGVDYSVATSGIAGPTGGTEEKPVGTVWIAVSTKNRTIAKKFIFGKNRERNILVSSLTALNMLRMELEC